VILVIDTSSALSAVALLDPSGSVVKELTHPAGRSFDLPSAFRSLEIRTPLSKIGVATGPGSFTGLRSGVSFGVGLAMGLGIPIVPLPTLELQAARADGPAVAVAEAGRGRIYYQVPGGGPELGEPGDLPAEWPVVGWLRASTEQAVRAAGRRFLEERELRSFGEAAAGVLKSAREAGYGSVKIAYMHSFSAGG
jgi:tRNA threonylcarbamoyl adenosine modification protein YeaZ